MKKFIVSFLVFLSIIALFLRFGYKPLLEYFGVKDRAGIRVESNQKAKVYINGAEVGNTPYQDENLQAEEVQVKVVPDTTSSSVASGSAQITPYFWQGNVKLVPGTLSVVNREIGDSDQTSSGEVITLEPGGGAIITSIPTSADVSIDGKDVGKTPLAVSTLGAGEHQFIISRDNYLKRSVRATVLSGYTLNLNVDLSISEVDLTKVPIAPITTTNEELIVKQTPTGFLRVRESANTSSKEVGRLNAGDNVTLIEESPNWMKVRLQDGKEGYVSSSYVEKKS